MQYKMKGHHVVARVPMGKHIHQAILVCDETDRYKERVLLEEYDDIFPGIYVLKLARELADILNRTKNLVKWDDSWKLKEDIFVHYKEMSNSAAIFISTKDYDYQIGVIRDYDDGDSVLLAEIICDMLN